MAVKSDITKSNIQEFIYKIDKVTNEEFDNMVISIYEVLRNPERPTKDCYLDLLVDYYLQTFSRRIFKILVGLSSPLDECLFNILVNKIVSYSNKDLEIRHPVLILISNIVQQNPAWLSKIINTNILNHFFYILKNEEEVVILGTSALILVELIATLPSIISQCLGDIFNCFSRLSTFLHKKKLHNDDHVLFLHLNSIVYRLFFRLYAMYPCNFINFLKINYGIDGCKENTAVFNQIIEPMLSRIKFHPLLITATRDKECDKSRWFYKEAHDILDECGQYVIDPIEFYPESEYSPNFGDDEDELCQLTDSISDEDKMEEIFNCENEHDVKNEVDSIFNKLNEDISSSISGDISLLSTSKVDLNNKIKNPEYAVEAISLSKENIHSAKFSSMSNINKSVVVPVAISAVSKINNNSFPRKSVSGAKTVCFSPFKPIKETENGNEYKNLKNKSPILNANISQTLTGDASMEQFHQNDNDDVDMEIVRISYNLGNGNNKSSIDFIKNNNGFSPLSDNQNIKEKSAMQKDFNVGNENSSLLTKYKLNDSFAEELVGNIKNSLKKANSRIRYQSHCLPESDKETDFFCPGESPSGWLSNLRTYSKSCPMLYFKNDDEFANILSTGTQSKKFLDDTGNQVNRTDLSSQNKDSLVQENPDKAKVNLILENPDLESKRINRSITLKKTCKSVDFTKEAKQKWRQFHSQTRHDNALNKLYSFQGSKRKDIFDSTSSMEMHYQQKMDTSHKKYTPHELLDRMLFLNSEFCHKEMLDRVPFNSNNVPSKEGNDRSTNLESRRNSILNTNSTASSVEHMPSMNTNEEDMRKQLAIMYAQLLFERHQRDSHVIRNRRLYKKSKECIELEEKYNALQEQLRLQEGLIEQLQQKLKDKMFDFNHHRKLMKDRITKVEAELEIYKNKCQLLENDKNNLEKRYKDEIRSLNHNYRNAELELNKYLCNFNNKNVDVAKLESENMELKNQLFLFGEFYNQIRDSYHKNKNVADLNDKLCIDALKYDNDVLSGKLLEVSSLLDSSKDKCTRLETQLAMEEAKIKAKNESNEILVYQDKIMMQDKQIESLKLIIVNYDKHINNLNGQILSKELNKSTEEGKTAEIIVN